MDEFRYIKHDPLLGYITVLSGPWIILRAVNGNAFIFSPIEDIDDELCHHHLLSIWDKGWEKYYQAHDRPQRISHECE